MLVTLDSSNFPSAAQPDGDDIRFTDASGANELSYWIENWDYAGKSAKIWVKVAGVPAGSSSVRMYYGNPSATGASNPGNTFIRVIEGDVLSLPMDEGSGTSAYDSSGNGNNGAMVNGSAWVDGKFGKALNFDGAADYVTIPHNTSLNPIQITVEAWIKAKPTSDFQLVMDKSHGFTDGTGWFLQIRPDGLIDFGYCNGSFTCGGTGFSATSTGIVTDDVWHHVVGTLDGVNIKLYIDDVLNDSVLYSGTPQTNTRDVHIGMAWGGGIPQRFFNGLIDEVRIYNRALAASEISSLYHNYGYTTLNYPGRVLVRKYASPEPTVSFGLIVIVNFEGVTNLTNISYAWNYIKWTWTDPSYSNFSKVMVYLDGKWKANVTKGTQYYNATGLLANTSHTIATRTVNTKGNISRIWVNNTATTAPDFIPPSGVTNLTNVSYTQNYIKWTWTDPKNPDFSKVMVFLDGKFKANVTKGKQYYNATGLLANSRHTISTHTVDINGNINQSWVNNTAWTAPDFIPPASITSLANASYARNYIKWTWTDPKDTDFSKVMVYLDGKFKKNVTRGTQNYNATSLLAGTRHNISTHTVDINGNINQTWVNNTAWTSP